MTATDHQKPRPYAARMAPEERREQLLDAVLRVIVSQGVHKVSMDSVAKEAGVTRPVVYGHFTGSNDLLRGSLAREEAATLAQLAVVMPSALDGSPVDLAIGSLERFLAAVLEAPDRWRAIFSLVESSTPQLRSAIEKGQRLAIVSLEDLARQAMVNGLDPDTDVELLARSMLAFVWDTGRLALAEPEAFPVARIMSFARSTINRQLDPRV